LFQKLWIESKGIRVNHPCVHHEGIWGNEGISPLIPKLYIMRGVHFHTLAALTSGEEPLVTIKQKTECAAELVCASSANGTAIPQTSSL
jgi:hypothetical protein